MVLTHDVERAQGQDKCRPLAELEMELGFRSSFNFVAEDYPVDRGLQRYLVENGFEIGLHGLNHRGDMFSPVRRFLEEAPRINRYLREWEAVGFRAPSMYRDFQLLGLLEIRYDSSSFDTDPFEPLPRGLGTIFPQFIASNPQPVPSNLEPVTCNLQPVTCNLQPATCNLQPATCNLHPPHGFIELPYTLPQDHTLFLILREKDISIWKRKLDWIAEKGGMALLNVHPDYMDMEEGRGNSRLSYPLRFYTEFLEYVRSSYDGTYWHALPRDVAEYCKRACIQPANAQLASCFSQPVTCNL